MRAHLELEGDRFRRGWGAAFFSGPSGTEVKKRRKPEIQRAESAARCQGCPASALQELPVHRRRPRNPSRLTTERRLSDEGHA